MRGQRRGRQGGAVQGGRAGERGDALVEAGVILAQEAERGERDQA